MWLYHIINQGHTTFSTIHKAILEAVPYLKTASSNLFHNILIRTPFISTFASGPDFSIEKKMSDNLSTDQVGFFWIWFGFFLTSA